MPYFYFTVRSTSEDEINEIRHLCDEIQKKYGWKDRNFALKVALKFLNEFQTKEGD